MAEWLIPDYEDRFRCKCGDCRRSCCLGWNISVSAQEYDRLLSAQGSAALRERLSCALEGCGDGAHFIRTEDGRCPLLNADGLCALQKECGETLLPQVCSAYPRVKRTQPGCEIALSASCEAVCELLFGDTAPLRFICRNTPEASAQQEKTQAAQLADAMHAVCMDILQNRALPLSGRVAHLHLFLRRMHRIENENGPAALFSAAGQMQNHHLSPFPAPESDWLHIAAPLTIAAAFMPESSALRAYWQPLLAALHLPDERAAWTDDALAAAAERYLLRKERFSILYAHHEQHFERLMVNWAFYTRLPFSGRLSNLEEEAFALAACYLLVRFVCVLCADGTPDSLIDIVSACMRLIEHSGFDIRCARYLGGSSFGDAQLLRDSILSL